MLLIFSFLGYLSYENIEKTLIPTH
jgi:hypothetical protein